MDGPCSDMDGSLAALFIEPKLPSMHHSDDESPDDLKHLLMRATLDLESARAQYECEVHHLKRLLRTAMQERDEAREEAMKLKESFLSSTNGGGVLISDRRGMASNLDGEQLHFSVQNSSKASSSPTLQQLDCISSSIVFEGSSARTQFSDLHWDLGELPDLQHPPAAARHSQNLPIITQQPIDVVDAANKLLANHDLHLDHRHGQQDHPHLPPYDHNELFNVTNTTIFQSSSQQQQLLLTVDSALRAERGASFPHLHRICNNKSYNYSRARKDGVDFIFREDDDDDDDDNNGDQRTSDRLNISSQSSLFDSLYGGPQHRSVKHRDMTVPQEPLRQHSSDQQSLYQDLVAASLPIGTSGSSHETKMKQMPSMNLVQDAETDVVAAADQKQTQSLWTDANGNGGVRSSAAGIACNKHLPEPPEADPEVMLRSLPERGKLLEAVMRAGPLLQTLLVTGPLPQWKCPPPEIRSSASLQLQKQQGMTMMCNNNQNHVNVNNNSLSECTVSGSQQIRHPMADICNDLSVLNGSRSLQQPHHHGTGTCGVRKPGSFHNYGIQSSSSFCTQSNGAAMLNTSANLSYSNCLLRNTSVLMPKRLVFSRPDIHRSLAHP